MSERYIKPTGMSQREKEIINALKAYGRPPNMPAHLRKLGEEVGELNEAVAVAFSSAAFFFEREQMIQEIADVIIVCLSMLHMLTQENYSIDDLLVHKRNVLYDRIAEGRFDRRYPPPEVKS